MVRLYYSASILADAPLSVPVRNRGYLHLMQLHTISMYNSPLRMASVCKNHSLAAVVHLIYILFEVV